MQTKIKFSLSILLIVALPAWRVFAQEGSPNNGPEVQDLSGHTELNLGDDKTLIMDPDAKPPKIQSLSKEAAPAQQANLTSNNKKQEAQPKPAVAQPDKTDEDLLHFNFLYFIIQKFKISDIVDDESSSN